MNDTDAEILRALTAAAYAVTRSDERFGFTYAARLDALDAAAESAADRLADLQISIDPEEQ